MYAIRTKLRVFGEKRRTILWYEDLSWGRGGVVAGGVGVSLPVLVDLVTSCCLLLTRLRHRLDPILDSKNLDFGWISKIWILGKIWME